MGNRELEWRVRTGASAGASAGAARREWDEMESKLQLLMSENNLLEQREKQASEELQREKTAYAELWASRADALATARQASEQVTNSERAARDESEAAREASEAAREAQALAAASDVA